MINYLKKSCEGIMKNPDGIPNQNIYSERDDEILSRMW